MKTNYKSLITDVEDFPIKGVNFKDISPLLASPFFKNAVHEMGNLVLKPDFWLGIESRGFIFASALAIEFGGGVLLCRKAGKLPGKIVTDSYSTEYSNDQLSLQIGTGSLVIVDDVLATGGTLATVNKLSTSAGYDVKDHLVLIDLEYVPRSNHYLNTEIKTVKSLISYE
ncbi:MAG: adenine phosphoribosyltransferase [Candidatus Marinimicrobia bacterium]|nr:adenine phosphoribosyltransferase [Candidatus Neomarinimicrobiota bacterium]|tara:strand:+ start:51 stop:560 length:510 start_codon:yes stop_codon:yes gene_type:complete